MTDNDGYPTDEELDRIRTWTGTDWRDWFAFIKSAGKYWPGDDPWGWTEFDGKDDFGKAIRVYHVSTGGWSGNEDIIAAMRENWIGWSMTWMEHRRGGHYRFNVRHD